MIPRDRFQRMRITRDYVAGPAGRERAMAWYLGRSAVDGDRMEIASHGVLTKKGPFIR